LIIPGESGYDRFTAKLDFKKIGSFLADTTYCIKPFVVESLMGLWAS